MEQVSSETGYLVDAAQKPVANNGDGSVTLRHMSIIEGD
jgi:hypothetical protein